jgi:RNA polymerase sigma-70 factor (ECF subfamily)
MGALDFLRAGGIFLSLSCVYDVMGGWMEGELPLLVARARRGDRAAFERMVRLTVRLVYAQVAAAVRDRGRAEDLTQETFVRAWKGIGTVTEEAGFVSWLLTVARNVVVDAGKSEGRAKRGGGKAVGRGAALEVVEEGGVGPGEAAELAEERGRVVEVLGGLPEEYRRVLMMRYLGGAGYEEIRRGLGLSDGALRGLLARGMAMMRERMTTVRGDGR